jgi:hypothetical protein
MVLRLDAETHLKKIQYTYSRLGEKRILNKLGIERYFFTVKKNV